MSLRLRWIWYLVAGFLTLQAADFLLTWLLLSGGVRADVYESNPFARSILHRGGWFGLAMFKLSVTAIALAAVLALANRRRLAAVRLLAGLCLVMLGVNAYSGSLLASTDAASADVRQTLELEQSLERRVEMHRDFVARRDRLCDDVVDGRLDVEVALEQLRLDVREVAPVLKMPRAGRLPDASRPDEMAMYFDYHMRARAADRGLGQGFSLIASTDPLTPKWLQAH